MIYGFVPAECRLDLSRRLSDRRPGSPAARVVTRPTAYLARKRKSEINVAVGVSTLINNPQGVGPMLRCVGP